MRASSTKKYYTGVILCVLVLLFQYQYGFSTDKSDDSSGPVIAGVIINSCVGSITISVTSGVGPYTYQWEDSGGNILPSTTFVITGLGPDNYTVTVTDANGDFVRATYTVTNPPDLTGSVIVNDVTCRGDSDAQVIVTMANGNPGYDWELFNSGGGAVQDGSIAFPNSIITIGGLGVDSYTLLVTDQDGCTGTINFVVTQPAQFLGANLVNQTNATCSDLANGSLEVVGTGGWGGYTYVWRNAANTIIGTNSAVSGLLPGTYSVTITDANGCQVNPNYTITGPAPITSTAAITDATCNGDSDGAIDITPAGGNGTFSYSWSNGAITQDISGVVAGIYTVTITDIQGCTLVENYTIDEPDVLTINEDIRNVDCHGNNTGRIRSNVTGGTAPYSYSWSNGRTGRNNNNIVAGSYSLTVTDANGCTTTENFTVTEPALALAVDSFTESQPSCFGGNDGTLQANVIGGTAPYSYSWSNGGNTAQITGITSGAYTVTVTDANGCAVVETHTLNDPVAISVSPSVTIPSCHGGTDGTITVSASNGAAPYTYNWNTGDIGPTINGLSAGTYTVTVTDNLGCSVMQDVILGEPSAIQSNATVNDISCNGLTDGSIFLAVTGGTAPYSYSWNTGATSANISGLSAGGYSVTITDGNGCIMVDNFTIVEPASLGLSHTQVDVLCRGNTTGSIDLSVAGGTAPYSYLWSTGANTQDVSSLAAGTYNVSVTDASGCSDVLIVTITEPATSIAISGIESHVTCNGSTNGSIDLTVTGGVAPYTYSWNNGSNTEDITALAAGSYSVQVTDANGCVENAGFTITQPSPFLVSPMVNDISCHGADDGSITLAVSGGTAPYTYSWADGPSTQNRSSLAPGNYTVTVTDANGCQNIQPLTITEPDALALTYVKQDVACFGENTGVININVTGGTAPYSYNWSNGALTEDLSNLVAGTYSVTVTDARGCTIGETVTITEPATALSFTSSVTQITCNGAADGQINLTVSGGTAPYTYNWSNGSTSEDLSSLPAATYLVTITDANGCTANGNYTITDPPVLVVSGVTTDIGCDGAADGSIDLTVSGGVGPYTFVWAHGPTSEDVNSLGPGAYTVQVLDSRGCSSLEVFTITEPSPLSLSTTQTNVLCFGEATGAIDLTVSGGTAPYFFNWSNGSGSEDLTSLTAGTYNVVVTDGNGCTANETVIITEPASALGVTEVLTQVTCNGLSNGAIDLTVSGGTGPYAFSWSDGFITEDRAVLAAGNYNVTITDANGCTLNEAYTITEPSALVSSFTKTDITCFAAADGTIDLSIAGGTLPYSILWSDGAITEDRSNLSPGTYSVVITDANGCQSNETVNITQPTDLVATAIVTDVDCFGNSTGAIDLTATGGTAPYTYSWSTGANTEDLVNLAVGTYTITVTDANGCTQVENIVVDGPAQALALNPTVNDITCFGNNDGNIQLNVTGGTAPYTYHWNTGATTSNIAGLLVGNYSVTVTDANGCTLAGNYTIDTPAALQITGLVQDLDCNAAGNGAIDLTVTGGTLPYTYSWSDGSNTEDLSGLSAGTYQVVVTDANGCTLNRNYTVTEPLALIQSAVITDVSCFGVGDGTIAVSVTGGVLPYSYSWSSGEVTEDLFNISGGNYTLTITDANGCQSVQNYIVAEAASALAVTGTVTNLTCKDANNGAIDLSVSGGTTPYSFSWNQGAITEDVVGLAAGTYQVRVTDAKGCELVQNYTVTEPPALITSLSTSNISCFGAADGSIDLGVSGGTAPYSYLWLDGPTTQDRSALGPGNYSVTITDANGCQNIENITITEPLALTLTTTKTDVLCFGESTGAIDLTASGGTAPYNYNWSNGANMEDLNGLVAGTYSVTVTDANGCVANETVVITQPTAALAISEVVTDVSCYGFDNGEIDITVTGGTAPYSYSWSDMNPNEDRSGLAPGSYTVTVTDANGCRATEAYTISEPTELISSFITSNLSCNGADDGSIDVLVSGGVAPYTYLWSDGPTTQDRSALEPGNYSVTITDANGCQNTENINITEPLALTLTATKTDVLCFGESTGVIDLTVSGGTAPYNYNWSNGATGEDLTGLVAGTYSVTVTDVNGCVANETVVITQPGAALSISEVLTDVSCNGFGNGEIDLTVTGGTAPYSYSWSDVNSSEDRSSLSPGSYTVTVTDANGCQATEAYTISEPTELISSFTTSDLSCNGADDGSIDVSVSGGVAPYTYLWSDGPTTQDRSALEPGNYNVTITDANGCQNVENITITEPLTLTLTATKTDVLCFGEATGAIDLTVSGGTAPYSYNWSNGATGEDLNGLAAGTYSVTVTDANGCVSMEAVVITQPAGALVVTETLSQITCNGQANGSIDLSVSGGTAPYTYAWGDGPAAQDRSALGPGSYTVTIADANGCQLFRVYDITEPNALTTSFTSADVSCFGAGDGTIDLAVSGGTSPYSFAWSDGPTTEDRNALGPGTYSVVISDANGCQNTELITITEPTELSLAYTVSDVNCHGGSDGSINITVAGGTAPYNYSWSNGSTAEDQLAVAAGTYSVTVTDANGCLISQGITVNQPATALALSAVLSNVSCADQANGSIDLTATGGTAPYSYSWNTGSSAQDLTGLIPGTYQVTVTDNLGCSTVQDYTITGPQPLSITGTVTNLSCRNADDGKIELAVSGGTTPFTYSWSDGQTSEDAVDLAAATYAVLVTDANGCTVTETFTVTQPLELVANFLVADVTCFGESDGSIDLGVSGGTAPYTYDWSSGETTQDLANIPEGDYTVVVSDAQGCQVTAAITVEAPSAALAAAADITNATCNGFPSGGIEVNVTGGTAPYSFAWSNGSSQQNLLNAFAGDYALTVTDINGCQLEVFYTIEEPDAINLDFEVVSTTCFGDNDGSIEVIASGGQAPYTYVWSTGSTSQDLFNLTGGTYNVTVTDANNCSITQAVVVGDSRDLSVVVSKKDIGCKGEIDGAISLNVTGGSGSYTYLWNNGSTTRDLSGVAAGVYHVVISDEGGCATTATVVISEPAQELSATIDKSDDLNCFGSTEGFATVVPNGGIAPYTYLWSNGARTASISGVGAGNYTVSVTDANGCVVQESFSIIQPEKPLEIMVSGNLNLACRGNLDGYVELEVTGGTAPYTYLWSTGATVDRISRLRAGDYTVRVVDAAGCVKEKQVRVAEPDELRIVNARVNQSQCFDDRNGSIELEVRGGTRPYSYQWSNQAITKNLIGISSGTYMVMITDARGCHIEATYELAKPELFRLQPTISEISCVGANDASISLNIEGGVGQLAIQWNTGNVGETITDLRPGQYNVTVTDENDCTLQQTFNIIEPQPINLDAFVRDATRCGDPRSGRINLIVSGGREPYTYRWTNGDTTQSLVDIFPGTYVVTVSDRYGCSATGTYSVQQPDPLQIGLRTDIVVNCENRTIDNRVTAEVSGGFGGYQYKWSRGGSNGPENLVSEPGRLTLLIVDDNGCELAKSVDISIPELGEADFNFNSESIVRDGEPAANDPVSFFDDSFGDIIDWSWDFGDGFDSREVDPIHTYNAPGTYTVSLTVTDGSGCTSTRIKEIVITEGYRIMVPDAFSPNGDGNNDFFRPRMLGLEKVQLLVFNTWGEVIFNTEDVNTPGWNGMINGQPAENGNYVYKLIGLSFNGLKVERDGVFALIN